MQHKSKTSSCAENVLFFQRKEKKRKEQPTLHDLAFLLILRTLLQPELQAFSTCRCSARSCPFVPLPSKLLSFFTNKIKIKKMQHYSKRSSFAEKAVFPKKKEKKRKKRDLTTSTSHSFSHCNGAAACAFFCRCSARSARSCPSGRFSLLRASRCSFKILLQYPWKLQRFAYKKPNLAAV